MSHVGPLSWRCLDSPWTEGAYADEPCGQPGESEGKCQPCYGFLGGDLSPSFMAPCPSAE